MIEQRGYDATFYYGLEEDAREFILAAANHFAHIHCFLPEIIVVHALRRMALPHAEWHVIKHGPICIALMSPGDQGCARLQFDLTANNALALRYHVHSDDPDKTNTIPVIHRHMIKDNP